MKEPKFRAWLGNEKSPGSNEFMIYSDDYPSLSEFFREYEGRHGNAKRLMQWTGLVDKSGKDIYEDDIIKNIHHGKKDFIVRYIIDGWCLDSGETPRMHDYICCYGKIDHVGNIHENPKLLEDQNVR